ncbi:MAG: FAD-binding oxidoreductase [Phycisphaerales bacterium]|nr:FAD-binding oxidoreductase [Phycisphaerales bacterium]
MATMPEVNDVQSRVNRTEVHSIVQPASEAEIHQALQQAVKLDVPVSIAGGRHSMGGQQFGTGTLLLDMQQYSGVVHFDRANGLIEVESGIMWPQLIQYLHENQDGQGVTWAVRQKQTGIDRVSIGGSLSSNIHGRGLKFPPFISDIESFKIINHAGDSLTCSRTENAELFSLAIGGYGLFGIVTHVTLRLVPRQVVKRMVEIIAVRNLLPRIEAALEEGFLYGDCQYSIDLEGDEEFHPGVFSCYKPVPDDTPVSEQKKQMAGADWAALYRLARTDKGKAFSQYEQFYLGTSGQVYWSDAHQLSTVFDGYNEAVASKPETEMITEIYVRAESLIPLMVDVRRDFVKHQVDMTYGTIRFIEPDTESFLPWATERLVCIVCNLHIVHTPEGLEKARADFRRIIDRVIEHGGRFFLTYHRWATREQVETCYPKFRDFLAAKLRYDPDRRFQSDWYRHYAGLFE